MADSIPHNPFPFAPVDLDVWLSLGTAVASMIDAEIARGAENSAVMQALKDQLAQDKTDLKPNG